MDTLPRKVPEPPKDEAPTETPEAAEQPKAEDPALMPGQQATLAQCIAVQRKLDDGKTVEAPHAAAKSIIRQAENRAKQILQAARTEAAAIIAKAKAGD
jgi:hypothetical protein